MIKWWKKKPDPSFDAKQYERERSYRALQSLPVVKEACAEIREAMIEQIVQAGPANNDEREYFIHGVKALDRIVAKIESYAQTNANNEKLEDFQKKVNIR